MVGTFTWPTGSKGMEKEDPVLEAPEEAPDLDVHPDQAEDEVADDLELPEGA